MNSEGDSLIVFVSKIIHLLLVCRRGFLASIIYQSIPLCANINRYDCNKKRWIKRHRSNFLTQLNRVKHGSHLMFIAYTVRPNLQKLITHYVLLIRNYALLTLNILSSQPSGAAGARIGCGVIVAADAS